MAFEMKYGFWTYQLQFFFVFSLLNYMYEQNMKAGLFNGGLIALYQATVQTRADDTKTNQ